MSAFVWIDRDGRRHELDSPAPIEAEVAVVAREMDRVVALLDNPDRMIRDPARAIISDHLQPHLERLRVDLANWNDHAIAVTRGQAAILAGQIDRLPAMIGDVLLVVELHAEHGRLLAITADASEMRARMLAEPMTALQRRAIAACASNAPPGTTTRAEAKIWLDLQPRFARDGRIDGGWFAWIDRKGHAHRLTDPLAIEKEVAAIAKGLANIRLSLTATSAPDTLYSAVNAIIDPWDRLQILQRDLERFDREATAREDTAWTKYAEDWRSKRKTS